MHEMRCPEEIGERSSIPRVRSGDRVWASWTHRDASLRRFPGRGTFTIVGPSASPCGAWSLKAGGGGVTFVGPEADVARLERLGRAWAKKRD